MLLSTIECFFYLLPALVLATWAQARITRAYATSSRIEAEAGITGAEAAMLVMREGGVSGVSVEPAEGELANYYDSRGRVLRLSRAVYCGRSPAALGVAAHEAGHAVRDAEGSIALVVRNLIVPSAGLGSQLFWLLITAGFLLGMARLVLWGVILFSVAVVLQLVNLPAEFAAGRRGRRLLQSAGVVSEREAPAVSRVFDAVAWSHAAAVLTGFFVLIFDAVKSVVLGRRERV